MENEKRKTAEKDLLDVLNGRLVLKQMLEQLEADHKSATGSVFLDGEVLKTVVVELAKLHNSVQTAYAQETQRFFNMLRTMPTDETAPVDQSE